MLIKESYAVDSTTSFDIEIAAAPSGMKLPLVIVVHGNFGLGAPFGQLLRSFTEQLAALGFVSALPAYYTNGRGNPLDTDIAGKLPALTAAFNHLSRRPDVDASRLALAGFSLGAGVSMAFINAMPAGTVRAFANFYGYVAPLITGGVTKFPPTIVFHNGGDPVVKPSENSEPLIDALAVANIAHEPDMGAYNWYSDHWELGLNHAFAPGGFADVDSRNRAGNWIAKHI
jgi:dienelactone hydrolase